MTFQISRDAHHIGLANGRSLSLSTRVIVIGPSLGGVPRAEPIRVLHGTLAISLNSYNEDVRMRILTARQNFPFSENIRMRSTTESRLDCRDEEKEIEIMGREG